MHISPPKRSTCSAVDQTNAKAICYPETNSNYNFCYISLVNPFVLLQSYGYGKQLNLHVYEMKKYMLMVHWKKMPDLRENILETSFLLLKTSPFSCQVGYFNRISQCIILTYSQSNKLQTTSLKGIRLDYLNMDYCYNSVNIMKL